MSYPYYVGSIYGIYAKELISYGEAILVTLRGRELEFRSQTVGNWIEIEGLSFQLIAKTSDDGEFVEWSSALSLGTDAAKELRLRAEILRRIEEAPPTERPLDHGSQCRCVIHYRKRIGQIDS